MAALTDPARCPDCGTELGSDPATEGICPRCLLSLALVQSALEPGADAAELADSAEREPAGNDERRPVLRDKADEHREAGGQV